ncbi:MAG: hypothetical protein JNL58_31415, partial [Planctomyces sp.]|nr:hypothetical protein [Planctomyces sp.]
FAENFGANAATGTVTRNTADLSAALTVTITSGDTSEATAPATVVIPAGQSSATFAIDAVDDAIVDGTKAVLFTTSATGFTAGTRSVDVTDNDTLRLTVSLDKSSFAENAGSSAATGTVTRNAEDLGAALTVTLTSSDTSEATVPATVVIPAGQSSATFTIAAIDDLVVDGSQSVTFTGAASSYTAGTSSLNVTDNDVLTLTVSLNKASFAENAGTNAATGTVSRNSADVSSALVVTLASSDTSEAIVPATVTILAGQSSATFAIDAVDDALVDGTQTASFSATATSYVAGAASLDVTDNDAATLTLTLNKTSFAENAGANAATGTVTRNTADLTSALTVTITSADTSEATAPATVTIPAGQSSATFAIDAVDDALVDGTKAVLFTTSATSFTAGTRSIDVTDNDTLRLTVTRNKSSIAETAGANAATGTVTRNAEDLGAALTVTLTSSDTSEATVPATVVIPAGQASATFAIAAVDDLIVDGSRTVTFTA